MSELPGCPCSICDDEAMPNFSGGHDWAVCKRDGVWRIYQRRPQGWVWHDSETTLPAAHTAATQYAVMDGICAPGGLTLLKEMQRSCPCLSAR